MRIGEERKVIIGFGRREALEQWNWEVYTFWMSLEDSNESCPSDLDEEGQIKGKHVVVLEDETLDTASDASFFPDKRSPQMGCAYVYRNAEGKTVVGKVCFPRRRIQKKGGFQLQNVCCVLAAIFEISSDDDFSV